ncbi:MAG: bifunctional (p)ppGpp synthetase/guanosine-3',5'-bis(diphosphate) 3'-pyrophosphohydrolase [Rhodospirillales bacterium]|nr:bifunctional (p)ppGpp synthetase/guanosine-3',5'-bis(diphosphate) 3'-pyrophosphohydrolase [Rhodospirillales bacterium]
MIRQFELVERVKGYDPGADEDALNRAYVFAMKAHGSQTRASGDPYFSHPLEVAGILTEFKVDFASIITALLHDTIEDTDTTLQEIKKLFGKEVAQLVDGVTKLTRIEFQSDQAKQAENFRKFVLAMSEDIRVLLVKLADRLHNMRTLNYIDKPEKRRRIAIETMDIYAPLAERIGMQGMKSELEDLAFQELKPEARKSIIKRLEFLREKGGDIVSRIIAELENTLADSGINASIEGREKTPYSVWSKMQHKDVGFEQLSDVMAFRVIVDTLEDCYRALGVAHGAYPVVPDRFKDYLSTPKPNGYRSLHTGVFGPEKQRIELQIRTAEMHDVAEHGVAAHWNYKQGAGKTEGPQYRWLRELLDIIEHAEGPEEFLEHTKLEMFKDQVFCFTPRGDLINLPRGATPVDFAYAVHSEVGDHCVGTKINGRMMPLRSELRNGDQVEIITSKAQTPSPTWENFVATGKARTRIRQFVRMQERDEYVKLGRAMLERAFDEEGYAFADKALKNVLKVFKQKEVDDLCAEVGAGNLTGREVIEAVFPGSRKESGDDKVVPLARARTKGAKTGKDGGGGKGDGVSIRGLIPGMAMHYAGCCHPLPGDRIVGIVTTGKGVTIHTIDCESLEEFVDAPERWLDVSWDVDSASPEIYVGRVHLTVLNVPGSLGDLSTVIARNEGNISNLKITTRTKQFFDMLIDIEVRDLKHLTNVIAALRANPAINSVERARG